MNAKVISVQTHDIALLEGSIQKWEKAVLFYETEGRAGAEPRGAEDCPLCLKYNRPFRDHIPCQGCPIRKDTGMCCCYGTPYDLERYKPGLEWAEKELAYLQDLLSRCVVDDPLSRHDELPSISDAP